MAKKKNYNLGAYEPEKCWVGEEQKICYGSREEAELRFGITIHNKLIVMVISPLLSGNLVPGHCLMVTSHSTNLTAPAFGSLNSEANPPPYTHGSKIIATPPLLKNLT